tara:strand:- start:1896 stop:3272 length:1377 start_codon:yes stop_codon:yes gene_type:complete
LSTALDVSGLYAIGGLLLVILGFSGIFLRKKDTSWNIQLATLMISWILISKGLQALIRLLYAPGSFDVTTGSSGQVVMDGSWGSVHSSGTILSGTTNYLTEVLASMNIMFNFFFVFLSALLALIFPINFLNKNKTTRIFSIIIFGSILISAIIFAFLPDIPLIEGLVNDPPAATIWGIIYLYSIFKEDSEDETWRNMADICALLMIAILGSYFFHWLGILLISDYYLSSGLSGTDMNITFYIPQISMAFSLFGFVILVIGESYRSWKAEPRLISYIVGLYFVIGALSHAVISLASDDLVNLQSVDMQENIVIQTWQTFTSLFHFYIGRPLLFMILLFKFNLVDTGSAEKSNLSRITIMLVVVTAATGIMEMLQEIMPIPEVFSAIILGIALAFAIGWEERIFEWLVKEDIEVEDPFSNLREHDSIQSDKAILGFQKSMIACLVLVFFSSILIGFVRIM